MKIADKLVNGLVGKNIPLENIFVDPLVQPISVNPALGMAFIDSIAEIKRAWPEMHTICGLSNVSYGLPGRKVLNRSFMIMSIAKGLDRAIVNPLDKSMMASIIVAEALAGRDDYCMKYLKAYRSNCLE